MSSCTTRFYGASLCLLILTGLLSIAVGAHESFKLLYHLSIHHLIDSATLESLHGGLVSLGALGALTIALSVGGLLSLRCNNRSVRIVAIANALLLVVLFAAQVYSMLRWPSAQVLQRRDVNNPLETSLELSLAKFNGDERYKGMDRVAQLSAETYAWNAMQRQLQCCRVNGWSKEVAVEIERRGVDGLIARTCCRYCSKLFFHAFKCIIA